MADEIIYVLYWHDGAPVEIEVRVGIDKDEAGYVMVDDEEVEDAPEAIQSALIESFGEIAELERLGPGSCLGCPLAAPIRASKICNRPGEF